MADSQKKKTSSKKKTVKRRGRPKGSTNKKVAKKAVSSAPKKNGRGRPKGSKNKPKCSVQDEPKRKRGRPKGSKNKSSKKDYVKKLESEILNNPDSVEVLEESSKSSSKAAHTMLEQIMFKLPYVIDPLIGTPKEVQKELDGLVLKMQKRPYNDVIFNKIHLYMHGYLINVVLKKFPFIRGLQSVDIYQETLIALRFKAIPGFETGKGMSFLNFAKLCIRRHLITLLNASKHRKKDQSMNRSISLDSSPLSADGSDDKNTFANIITDNKDPADKIFEASESFTTTKHNLMKNLSSFEQIVLAEYLTGASYREVSRNVSKRLKKRCNTKSIDNALLRIRKKALQLLEHGRPDDLPIFIPDR